MAHPKRQHSKQRGRKRRTHDKLKQTQLKVCTQCGKPTLSHRVCPFCGYYKGQMIIDMGAREAKKAKKQERNR